MKKLLATIFIITATHTLFAQKRTYTIGVLMDKRTEKIEPLITGLQEQIKTVVGEDAIIRFLNGNILVNNYDVQAAERHYQTLIANDTDIILAFGVVNNKVINNRAKYPKPTILFGAVNKDFNGIDITKKASGIENFTYLIESESFLDDFKTFKQLTDFKTLGVAIDRPFVDLLPLKATFDTLFAQLGAKYKLIPFDSAQDITANLSDIDAFYLAGGFFLDQGDIEQLAKMLIEKQLPSFTSLGVPEVQMGLMATNQSDENFDQFFRRIALTVEGYVNGVPLAEMPVFVEYSPNLTINYNTAQQVNVPLKYSLIANTSFVGEPNNALINKKFSFLEIIDGVLGQNLSLQSQQKDVDLSGQDVRTAKSNYLPNISASGTGTYVDPDSAENSLGQNPEFSTSGNITLQQTLFSEAANANISIQENLLKAQQEEYNAAALDAIFDGSNAYFNILILKANVQIQMRNLELTKQNLKIAEQNFDAGQSGKSDVLRFRSQLAQDTQAVVEAINQLEQGFLFLNQLLNNPLDMEIDIEDVALDKGVFTKYNYEQLVELLDSPSTREPFTAFLVEEAKKNAPELKSLQFNLEAIERNLRLNSEGRFLPTLALQGQYNRTFSRSGAGSTPPSGFTVLDDGYNASLNLSIPLLNQNQTNINRQINSIQKQQLNINMENSELAIDSNVRSGVLNVVNQIANIELSTVSEEAAQESLALTQTAYNSGAVSVIQLIDAQNNYLNAQLASTNAVYNFLINSLQLERFLGYYFLLKSESENAAFTQRFLDYLNNKN